MDISDEKLMELSKKKDRAAFEILTRRYLKQIYNFAYRLVGNKADAEDITQDVFIKVWKNVKRFDASKSFKAWIFTIAKNTSFDFLKKKLPLSFSELENDEEGGIEQNIPDETDMPRELMITAESAKMLDTALNKLSPKSRTLILFHFKNDFSFTEISEILGEPLNTVKSRYRRALMMLKNHINAPKSSLHSY